MQIDNYYSKEKKKYWFYSFLPALFAIEALVYSFLMSFPYDDLLITGGICATCFFVTAILVLLQVCSIKKFKNQISELTKEQKADIERAAAESCKVGNLLITKEVIIVYNMFTKKIIFISSIKDAKLLDGEMEVSARYAVTVKSNTIALQYKSGKTIQIKGPALYTGEESKSVCYIIKKLLKGEEIDREDFLIFEKYTVNPPYNAILFLTLTGALLFLLWIFSIIRYHIVPVNDNIERLLLYTGYAHVFDIIIVLLFLLVYIAMFFLKNKFIRDNKADWLSGNVYVLIVVISVFILAGNIKSGGDYAAEAARADYHSYKNGEFQTTAAKMYVSEGILSGIDWMNNDAKRTIQEYEMNVRYLCSNDEVYLLIDHDIEVEREWEYELKYLKHTHIVTEIQCHTN